MNSENSNARVKNLEDETLMDNESLNEMIEKIADTSFISKQIANFSDDLLKMTSTALMSNISKIPSVFENSFDSVLTNDLYKNLLQPIYETIKSSIVPESPSAFHAYYYLGKNCLAWWMDLNQEEVEIICSKASNPDELDLWIENELIPAHPKFVGESFKIIDEELDDSEEYLKGLSLSAHRAFKRNEPEGIGVSLVPIIDNLAFKFSQKRNPNPIGIGENCRSISETCGELPLGTYYRDIQYTYTSFTKAYELFVAYSNFKKDPDLKYPNRHRLAHGQRKKRFDLLDAYKVLSILASLILLGRFCRDYCEAVD